MRKRRIFIFEDNPMILLMLRDYLGAMDYEIMSSTEPIACPLYLEQSERCDHLHPCTDILLADFNLPVMSGLDMILKQEMRGCRSIIKNKAVMSGNIDQRSLTIMKEKGIHYFQKPFKLSDFKLWLQECDERIDLSQPLGIKRKSIRSRVNIDVSFLTDQQSPACRGQVADISPEGLRLNTSHKLEELQTIIFETTLPNSCVEAQVRWVKRMNGSQFSAGLQCSSYSAL